MFGNWSLLYDEMKKGYFAAIFNHIREEISKGKTIAPPVSNIFNIFKTVPFEQVKVVILGQDPYPTEGAANGLAFAVNESVAVPRSLSNIFKEVMADLQLQKQPDKTLLSWTEQGVVLLNTILTTNVGEVAAHKNFGWQNFTDRVIQILNDDNRPKVFLLWGKHAQTKTNLLTNPSHLILKAAHPSPLSASSGFFGCKHFSKANHFLKNNQLPTIDWSK
jgi:uracil-DNA glycosylase